MMLSLLRLLLRLPPPLPLLRVVWARSVSIRSAQPPQPNLQPQLNRSQLARHRSSSLRRRWHCRWALDRAPCQTRSLCFLKWLAAAAAAKQQLPKVTRTLASFESLKYRAFMRVSTAVTKESALLELAQLLIRHPLTKRLLTQPLLWHVLGDAQFWHLLQGLTAAAAAGEEETALSGNGSSGSGGDGDQFASAASAGKRSPFARVSPGIATQQQQSSRQWQPHAMRAVGAASVPPGPAPDSKR
jgi:hypothetical protein